MSAGAGYTQATRNAWAQAGQANIEKSGLTWEKILGSINAPTGRGGSSGSVDTEKKTIDIPGMGTFRIYYDSPPMLDANGHPMFDAHGMLMLKPYGPVAIAREGGTQGGAEGGLYPDTMVGYAVGPNGKLVPFSAPIDKSDGAGQVAMMAAAVLTGGLAAGAFGGAAAAGSSSLGAAETAGVMGAGGASAAVEPWALAAGAAAPEAGASAGSLASSSELGGGLSEGIGYGSGTGITPGASGVGLQTGGTGLGFAPGSAGLAPATSVESAISGAGSAAAVAPYAGPVSGAIANAGLPAAAAPYAGSVANAISGAGTVESPLIPPGGTAAPSGATPGSTETPSPATPSPINPLLKTLLPKLLSTLAGSGNGTGTAAGTGSGGFGSLNQVANETPGMIAPPAMPTNNTQAIANALLLQNPNQPTFNPLAYTPVQKIADALQQDNNYG